MIEMPIIDAAERLSTEHTYLEKMRELGKDHPWTREEIRKYEEDCRR